MRLIKYRNQVATRSDLLSLLSEACELEHGLACSYLYSAFSIKKENGEGLKGDQIQHTRKWAAKIFFIAAQEMLHLSQVWNLLNAIGGSPYYFRPNFPQPSKYYPFHVPLKLEAFSLEALKRFIMYELPSDINEKKFAKESFGNFSEDNYQYKTVGELYHIIREGFNSIDEAALFIGSPDLQMGPEEIDFREIIKVTDKRSAIAAIDMITEQGEGIVHEGSAPDRQNSHYESFCEIDRELRAYLDRQPGFDPARNILTDPITFDKGNYSVSGGEILINELTRKISDVFDDIYNLMLRGLQFAFSYSGDKDVRQKISKVSIILMIRLIRPLGELLTQLPAYNDNYLKKAGPSFALTRHIPFPAEPRLTVRLFIERGNELSGRLATLKKQEARLAGLADAMKQVLAML